MRTPIGAIALLFAFIPFSFAQESGLSPIESLPTCALLCVANYVQNEKTTCPATGPDKDCICSNERLQAKVEVCVRATCTMKQALTTKNTTVTMCDHPIRDKSNDFRIPNIALQIVSAVFVVLRIGYKLIYTVDTIRLDDYLVIAAFMTLIPGTIVNDLGTLKNGAGRDIWTLEFEQITMFGEWFFVVEILYMTNIALLKLSLLAFYHYIFPGPKVRKVIWLTALFNVLYGVSFVLTAIFQCRPIRFFWEKWDNEHVGHCININAMGWAHAAINIAIDIWMLAIPLYQVSQLKLAWKKKIGVALMFCVGTFVTIISIVRLQSLVTFANSPNPTYDQLEINNWSTIEINVGIICACMPSIRVVLVRLFPKVFGGTSKDRSYGLGSSNMMGGHKTNPSKNNFAERSIITYTKTFEVQHTSKDSDEVGLVAMDNLRRGSSSHVRSGNASQVSV